MLVSAELRWFWKEGPPHGLDTWFGSGSVAPGGGSVRRDEYLVDSTQTELGIKKRGGRNGVEVKGLVGIGDVVPAPFAGQIQLWTKWTSSSLSIDTLPRIVVAKARRVRKFETEAAMVVELALGADEQLLDRSARPPERGCLVELVNLELGQARTPWCTFAFEAFGPLDSVQDSLQRTAAHLARSSPPSLDLGLLLSYPAWLARSGS